MAGETAGETTARAWGTFEVDASDPTCIDLEALRARREALMPDGEHAWVIAVVHELEDPEQALDDMVLDETSLVGVTNIYCLICSEVYATANRYYKCSQRRVAR